MDSTNPLDPHGELSDIVSDCVHCGFCLPSCPTSRSRSGARNGFAPRPIDLISQLLERRERHRLRGGIRGGPGPACRGHAPGTAAWLHGLCPGLPVRRPLRQADRSRPLLVNRDANHGSQGPVQALPPRSPRERALRAAIFATFPYPARLRLLMAPLRAAQRTRLDRLMQRNFAERLAPEISAALKVAPGRPAKPAPRGRLPARVTARGPRRAVVGMLTGCVQQVFFPQVNIRHRQRVLAAEGCNVVIPPTQGCCGALSSTTAAQRKQEKFAISPDQGVDQAGVDAIVVNSAGCGSAMKEYEDTPFAAKVKEGLQRVPSSQPRRAATTPSPGQSRLPRRLPPSPRPTNNNPAPPTPQGNPRPRTTQVARPQAPAAAQPAYHNLVQPATAAELGTLKAASALETVAPDLVVSANPGCALQINATSRPRSQSST